MKFLITGNMGYVGPGVISQLRSTYPGAELIGFDTGYFARCLTNTFFLPENKLSKQVFGDVRKFPSELLNGIDSIVYLAAISNDPMGKKYEEITLDVNYRSAVKIAKEAKSRGVKNFVFASSCSMYGAADDEPKVESDQLNPLTAYARSKVNAERELQKLADKDFTITSLRFATACGYSTRLRLDLVLNDFLAGAVTSNEITILSDGTPWRPLINVMDMARAIEWAAGRDKENGGEFLAVNTGSNIWNYQVKALADTVAEVVPGVKVSVNPDAPPDKRSYKVNFDLFRKLAPDHQPVHDLKSSIQKLYDQLKSMEFKDKNYRESQFIRLKVLSDLQEKQYLDSRLEWNW
ncbi:MAG: SDR family oxidoreductase [Bacteroidales bacterium]